VLAGEEINSNIDATDSARPPAPVPRSQTVSTHVCSTELVGTSTSMRELLSTILLKFGGGPVGLSTLAVALGEEQDTIEDVYEPFLLQLGFLQRTPRGRIITELGREQLGAPPAADGTKLF
jgi:Holliday junction DNA helicase RuvB